MIGCGVFNLIGIDLLGAAEDLLVQFAGNEFIWGVGFCAAIANGRDQLVIALKLGHLPGGAIGINPNGLGPPPPPYRQWLNSDC